jgi:hypothetical protein
MGGTWVHWFQPFIYREIARYGLAKVLESSHDFEKGLNCHELITSTGRKTMSHDDEVFPESSRHNEGYTDMK